MTNRKVLAAVAALCMVLLAAGVFCGAACCLEVKESVIEMSVNEGGVVNDVLAQIQDARLKTEQDNLSGLKIEVSMSAVERGLAHALSNEQASGADDENAELKAKLKNGELKSKLDGAKETVDKAISNVKGAVSKVVSDVKDQYADAKYEREVKLEVVNTVRTGLNADTEREVIAKLAALELDKAEDNNGEIAAKAEFAAKAAELDKAEIKLPDPKVKAAELDKAEIKLPDSKVKAEIEDKYNEFGDVVAKAYPEACE